MTSALFVALAIGTLILPPNNGSQALSSATYGSISTSSSPQCRYLAFSSGHRTSCLRAVAENTVTAETCPEADGSDIPTSTGIPPTLTVVAGPGARITSVSNGVAVEQIFWENNFDPDDRGRGSSFADTFPTRDNTRVVVVPGIEEKVVVDYDPFPDKLFNGEDIHVNNIPAAAALEIKNESDQTEESDSSEETTEDSSSESDSTKNNESNDSVIRSAMAKSALLHRAGIAGSAKKSSRSNGRSSRAKTHVNKNRRGSGGVGAMGRVLGTVRTAAAAAAAAEQKKKLHEGKEHNNAKGNDNNLTANHSSLTAKHVSSKWRSAVQSTVAEMLENQDAVIQQQSVDVSSYTETADSPPPGTASMGLLGEVVQDSLPVIPPLPGAFLVRTKGDLRNKRQVIIRSSIPHSFDDTHIANLRLSVFSRFDEEQQQIFRSRSVEVLNVRRRRGAVVLVAEVPNEGSTREEHPYLNEMQTRIANGHQYGEMNSQSAVVASHHLSPILTVTPIRGAKVTSVSSRVVVDGSPSGNDRGSIIGSVECSHQEFRATMLGASRPKGSLLYVTEVAVRTDARRCGAGAMLMKGVDEVATLRNIETIYLHVDVTNRAACAMYENCGFHYLDKREPIYAQFTASLNLHDGAMHGRRHYLMCKHHTGKTTWLDDDDLCSETRKGALGLLSI